MSNAKVERRKQEKYNRKKIERKKKIKAVLAGTAITVILLAIAGLVWYQIDADYFKYDRIKDIDISKMYTALTDVQSANVADKEETTVDESGQATTEVTPDDASKEEADKKADDEESEDDNKDKESKDE